MIYIHNKAFQLFFILGLIPQLVFSQYYRIDTTQAADWLISQFFLKDNQSGIQIKNIKYSGEKISLGYFIYKGEFNVLPSDGIILSTGNVLDSEGSHGNIASTENHSDGDSDIEMIVNNKSFDAAKIEFDFMSFSDSVSFSYVFASEEYPEYVNYGVSDAFAFLICEKDAKEKINIGTLPNSTIPITIDLINNKVNNRFFINNSHIDFAEQNYSKAEARFYYENNRLFEFDGFTVVLETGIKLNPYSLYHFKIVIADVGDQKFDSWVLLKANSFSSCGEVINPSDSELKEYFKHFTNDSINIAKNDNSISITAPIYFDFNRSGVRKDSYLLLDQLISILKYSNYAIEVNGYADKIGEIKYNQKLSQQRADNVKAYLVLNGISESRILSFGKGIFNLENNNLSRKVEFILK